MHSFGGEPVDGAFPLAGLVFGHNGSLYGTTEGGSTRSVTARYGTVFELTPPATAGGAWTETVLWSFTGGNDGAIPNGSLFVDPSGALYGATSAGGSFGEGTIFKLTPPSTADAQWIETVLYNFMGGSDGRDPNGGLIMDNSGAFYGTTVGGGSAFDCLASSGCGTLFKLTPPTLADGAWTESILYTFEGGLDGGAPSAGLVMSASDTLYGTTLLAGDTNCSFGYYGCGTVFELTPPVTAGSPWAETVLHTFSGSDGANPHDGLISDTSGTLYGTTSKGGSTSASCPTVSGFGCGTAFTLATAATFSGIPGQPDCIGESTSTLARRYRGLASAADVLRYASVQELQNAIAAYCRQ